MADVCAQAGDINSVFELLQASAAWKARVQDMCIDTPHRRVYRQTHTDADTNTHRRKHTQTDT